MSPKIASTVGFERDHNELLAIDDPDEFVTASLERIGAQPPNFRNIVAINRGELLTDGVDAHPLTPGPARAANRRRRLPRRLRGPACSSPMPISPGPTHISILGPGFASRLAWLAEPDQEIVFAGRDEADGVRAVQLAQAVGLRNLGGFLDGGMTAWREEEPAGRADRADQRRRANRRWDEAGEIEILDVREPAEYEEGHIPGSPATSSGTTSTAPGRASTASPWRRSARAAPAPESRRACCNGSAPSRSPTCPAAAWAPGARRACRSKSRRRADQSAAADDRARGGPAGACDRPVDGRLRRRRLPARRAAARLRRRPGRPRGAGDLARDRDRERARRPWSPTSAATTSASVPAPSSGSRPGLSALAGSAVNRHLNPDLLLLAFTPLMVAGAGGAGQRRGAPAGPIPALALRRRAGQRGPRRPLRARRRLDHRPVRRRRRLRDRARARSRAPLLDDRGGRDEPAGRDHRLRSSRSSTGSRPAMSPGASQSRCPSRPGSGRSAAGGSRSGSAARVCDAPSRS